jgi:MFS family permease
MPWGRTFLLGFGFFGITLLWTLYDAFVPILLNTFGLAAGSIGFLMTMDNWANLFIQPYVGVRSDHTRTRWGRRYPYIMVGAPLAAIGAVLIPLAAARALPLLVGAMFIMTLSMAIFRSPTVALLGDVFPSELRSKANGVINFMGVLAGVIALLAVGRLFDVNRAYPFWIGAVGMLVVLGLLIILVREPRAQEPERAAGETNPGFLSTVKDLGATVKSLYTNTDRSTLFMLTAILTWSVGIGALQTFFTLFGQQELGLTAGTAGALLSFYPLSGLLFAIPGGYLGTYLGRRRTIILCLVIVALLLISFLSIPSGAIQGAAGFQLLAPATWFADPTLRTIILLLMGAGGAMTIITVNSLPMLYDVTPGGRIGSATGLYYLFGSVASIIGPPLAGVIVDVTGTFRAVFIFATVFVFVGLFFMAMVRGGDPVAQEAREQPVPA